MINFLRDIVLTYINPAAVMHRKIARGLREEQLLAYVFLASLITFLIRAPSLIAFHRAGQTGTPLATEIGGMFITTMLFGPLFYYALAAIAHLIARKLGGKGDWQKARLALFWTILAMQPLVIAYIYLLALVSPGWIPMLLTTGVFAFFLWTWGRGMAATEAGSAEHFA